MNSWHSYPSIYALGHKAIAPIHQNESSAAGTAPDEGERTLSNEIVNPAKAPVNPTPTLKLYAVYLDTASVNVFAQEDAAFDVRLSAATRKTSGYTSAIMSRSELQLVQRAIAAALDGLSEAEYEAQRDAALYGAPPAPNILPADPDLAGMPVVEDAGEPEYLNGLPPRFDPEDVAF